MEEKLLTQIFQIIKITQSFKLSTSFQVCFVSPTKVHSKSLKTVPSFKNRYQYNKQDQAHI